MSRDGGKDAAEGVVEMLYQQYELRAEKELNFDKDIHRYYYGKVRGQARKCTPTFFHPSRRLSPEEATAERVAYNWEVVYDIDRSDVTSVLENFENTYTQVEDFY